MADFTSKDYHNVHTKKGAWMAVSQSLNTPGKALLFSMKLWPTHSLAENGS